MLSTKSSYAILLSKDADANTELVNTPSVKPLLCLIPLNVGTNWVNLSVATDGCL